MSTHPIDRYLTRYPRGATLIYGAAVVAMLLTSAFALVAIVRQYQALGAAAETLATFERRKENGASDPAPINQPPGSPFLEGPTVTVASAALLQQLTNALTRAGGSVISSEVDNQFAQSKDGFVRIRATGNIEQTGLQQLLFDLESGMPFVFVDQLSARMEAEGKKDGLMRVSLGVTGLWSAGK
jgi:general secretion pathway protein M